MGTNFTTRPHLYFVRVNGQNRRNSRKFDLRHSINTTYTNEHATNTCNCQTFLSSLQTTPLRVTRHMAKYDSSSTLHIQHHLLKKGNFQIKSFTKGTKNYQLLMASLDAIEFQRFTQHLQCCDCWLDITNGIQYSGPAVRKSYSCKILCDHRKMLGELKHQHYCSSALSHSAPLTHQF